MRNVRLARLFGILSFLSPYSMVTIKDLAREYEVDERTIYRDVQALNEAKIGVYFDGDWVRISRCGYRQIQRWLNAGTE